jgi:toxin YhaV
VYAWVNDEDSKRSYDSKTDAYLVFRKMLESGDPPDDWDELLGAAKNKIERLDKLNLEI